MVFTLPRRRAWARGLGLWLAGAVAASAAADYKASRLVPPPPAREFRGVWVASVSNINWPSRPGLPVAQQKAELLAILDRAAALRLNAVILQVRPACDALYISRLEPWSEYLTGQMGRPPEPLYDPLAFAVAEAHARGLELHAWINPFRARHTSAFSPIASSHVSKVQPAIAKTYGKQGWLDPGEPAAQEYSLKVILDIVRRYEVDGIHMDDYFYPYKEKDAGGKILDFPDEPSWQRYQKQGGKLERADWRRENINQFLQRVYRSVKADKPWVRVGISPFGIWRSKVTPEISGYDPYENLYADSRKWLVNGWLDYLAPQLYWAMDARGQAFAALLKWWGQQNPKGRHLWPGMNSVKTGSVWAPEEILGQIRIVRGQSAAPGHIHWSYAPFGQATNRLGEALLKNAYLDRAIPPASPWLGRGIPGKPKVHVGGNASTGQVTLQFELPGRDKAAWWVIQSLQEGAWRTEMSPASRAMAHFKSPLPQAMAISAVDRYGNLGAPTVLERRGKR